MTEILSADDSGAVFFESAHKYHHKTPAVVTAAILAESLLGLEDLVDSTLPVISKILGERFYRAEIEVKSIQIASIWDDICIRFFLGDAKEQGKITKQAAKELKIDKLSATKKIGAVLVTAIAMAGAKKFLESDAPEDKAKAAVINTTINNYGAKAELSPGQLQAAFEDLSPTQKKAVTASVIKLARPDGNDEGGSIVIDDDPILTVPADVVDEIPKETTKVKPEITATLMKDMQLLVRAADLDKPLSGWAIIVPDVTERRLPLKLDPDVDPAKVPVGKFAVGDVLVHYKLNSKNKRVPVSYTLMALRKKDAVPTPKAAATSTDSDEQDE